jgi:hypothetical protein
MPIVEIPTTYPSNGDSYATGSKSTYPPTFQNAQVNTSYLPVTRSKTGATAFTVTVALIRFDTASIPDNATIIGAKLILNLIDGGVYTVADARALCAEWYDAGAATDAGDFTTTAGVTAHGGTLLSSIASVIGEVSLSLTNLASINKTGVTGIRLHITGAAPTGNNRVHVAATNAPPPYTYSSYLGGNVFRRSLIAASQARSVLAPVLVIEYGEAGQNPGETDPPGTNPGTVDPEKVGNGVVASPSAPRTNVRWRVVLCDRKGDQLQILDGVAAQRTYEGRMNKQAKFSFQVPSDHPRVAGLAPDGLPWLSKFRVVKAYREEVMADGSSQFVIRFCGEVWILGDSADSQGKATTRVTAYDSLQRLASRFTGPLFKLDQVDGAQIVRQLVDETNTRSFSGMNTSEGKFETSPPRYVEYTRKSIGAAIVDLANAFNGFDFEVRPVDRDDGTLNVLSVFSRLGQHQPSIVLQWGMGSHNISGVERTESAELIASQVHGLGSTESYSEESQGTTQAFGLLEAVDSFSDITNHDLLVALVQEELNYRIRSREIVSLSPVPGLTPEPWTHFHPGDTFTVEVDQSLRGGFSGIMRCYGWNVSIDDDGIERVTELMVTPE